MKPKFKRTIARVSHPVDLPAGDLKNTAEDGIPIAPSLLSLPQAKRAGDGADASPPVDRRVLFISALAVLIAVAAAFVARLLTALIGLVTNFAYYGRVSTTFASPAGNHLGLFALFVPVIGGLIVGLLARYGSRAIRGHGIPEAMEQILVNQSRIPPRITILKPLSAAIAIGTGGPFGAEGPVIATGGALGSLVGQLLHTTAPERKTLLAAGAAAGMTATFGSPVAAVVLAVELLLFELRPASLIPVALASVTATGVRFALLGTAPAFAMPDLMPPGGSALLFYTVLGAAVGLVSVGVTRLVYAVEDAFERLPIHWVWWPALGGLAVGVVGLVAPRTLGVGYDNIDCILSGTLAGQTVLFLCVMKLISWAIALGSGTSGGTLAPLFTIGGGMGAFAGGLAAHLLPQFGIDLRIAALVGMAAIFAGASRALLASIIFAFETTRQPLGLLPLLGGCTTSYLISCLLMQNTIMTEKITRRGIRVPTEYRPDAMEEITVQSAAAAKVITLAANANLETTRAWLTSDAPDAQHGGYPVVDEAGRLIGVITRRDLFISHADSARQIGALVNRPPVTIFADNSLRHAVERMVREDVGRLPVVTHSEPNVIVGILTRRDVLAAQIRRVDEHARRHRHLTLRIPRKTVPYRLP